MMLGIGKTGSFSQSTLETESNIPSRHCSVRIHFRGERENFSLYTGNKAAAAVRARDIYTGLVSKGWQATREQFKSAEKSKAKSVATVADFFDRIRETNVGEESTLEEYFSAFRLIVAESFGIDGGKQKYVWIASGGSWLLCIDAMRSQRTAKGSKSTTSVVRAAISSMDPPEMTLTDG